MPDSATGERRKEPSPVPDMTGDRKNMAIPIRCSNLCIRTAAVRAAALLHMAGRVLYVLLLYMVHAAAQGLIGERTGPNSRLGERGASKGAVPGPRYGGGS